MLYSISDNNAYLRFNRDPVDRMLEYLRSYFDPKSPGTRVLAGHHRGHGRRAIVAQPRAAVHVRDAVDDAVARGEQRHVQAVVSRRGGTCSARVAYQLTNTGQGLNRVQSAPGVNKAIHQVLARCQSKLGGWVGSSVVHLGDHNVPNALMFIDKYTQVPRILNPVVLVASQLEKLCEDEGLRAYVESTFGGVERCRKTILADFFRHAFDGSGADNFFDAGLVDEVEPVAGTGRTRSRRRVTTRCLSSRVRRFRRRFPVSGRESTSAEGRDERVGPRERGRRDPYERRRALREAA